MKSKSKAKEASVMEAGESEAIAEQSSIVVSAQEGHAADVVSQMRVMGSRILVATVAVGDMYFQLCSHIRRNSVPPTVVRAELGAIGFHKVRVSEIIKVAHAPDDLWDKLQAKSIGFNRALALTRESIKQLAAENPSPFVEHGLAVEDVEEVAEHVESEAKAAAVVKEEGKADLKHASRAAYNKAVQAVLVAAERCLSNGVRLKSSTHSHGGRVELRINIKKAPKTKTESVKPEIESEQE